MSEIDTSAMQPFTLTIEATKILGPEAGTVVADIACSVFETFGPAAAERFCIGVASSLVGCAPVMLGDENAIAILEAAVRVLRSRIEAGESLGGDGAALQ